MEIWPILKSKKKKSSILLSMFNKIELLNSRIGKKLKGMKANKNTFLNHQGNIGSLFYCTVNQQPEVKFNS